MKRSVYLMCAFLGCAFVSSAQLASTTALVGTVTDETGKVVPGAEVVATNTGTNDTYRAQTNEQGNYNIQFVRIGTYDISAQVQGFQTQKKTGIQVQINQVVRTDFGLVLGNVVQEVTVAAPIPVLNTDDASVSETLGRQSVVDLPLNGRDPLRLAITAPGVIQGQKATNGTPPGQDFIGAGTREVQNAVSLDGISIVNNLITNVSMRPNVDAIQEFQIQTGTYGAQYGMYMGVHMNLITKSGSNSLHGTAFEFLRNDKLDARGFFENPTKPKNPLRQNQFGFELDGPILIPKIYNGRNKTFFMGSYEGLRQVRSSSQTDTVLTPLMRQGNFSEVLGANPIRNPLAAGQPLFAGNIIPQSQISPYAASILQYMPLPNLPGTSNNYLARLANNNNTDQTIERVDHNIGDKIRLFFRYTWQDTLFESGSTNPINTAFSPVKNVNWVVGYTHTLNANMVNEFRFGRQRIETSSLNPFANGQLTGTGASLGIPGFNGDVLYNNPGIPDFNIAGYMSVGAQNAAATNWYQDDATWQGSDVLSYQRGNHNIQAGFELRRLGTGRAAVNSARGVFNFNGQLTGFAPADLLVGLPQSITTPGPEIRGSVSQWRDGFFLLDNWQVNRKLTLNIGLRYEYFATPHTVNGNATLLNPEQTAIIPPNPPVPGYELTHFGKRDFAPRIGFAFRATPKTVIRGGYGIYYNPNQMNSYTFLNTNPPFSSVFTLTSLPSNPTLSLANPIPGGPTNTTPPNVITLPPNMNTPYMNQWSFDVQQEMWRGGALEVQYLGSHSVHLDRNFYNNTPQPGPGPVNPRRPNPNFTVIRTIQNDVIANYDGMNVVLRQRGTKNLTILASYTWSHSLDVTTDSNGGGTPMDPYNWRLDYGNSNWDVRHRFVASYVYDIPFWRNSPNSVLKWTIGNWQVNGITTLQSGFPFNVTVPTDIANNATPGPQRPNLVHAPSSNCAGGQLFNCIDASAFALPAPYTYGNAGRNILRGPHIYNTDFSLFKNFPITEQVRVQFRAELFNVFNTPIFANPRAVFGTSTFGTVASTQADNREIQFGLKFLF